MDDEDSGVAITEDPIVCRISSLEMFPCDEWTPYLPRRTGNGRWSNVSVTAGSIVAVVVSTRRHGCYRLDDALKELAHPKATCRVPQEGGTGDLSIKRVGSGPASEASRAPAVFHTSGRCSVFTKDELKWLMMARAQT